MNAKILILSTSMVLGMSITEAFAEWSRDPNQNLCISGTEQMINQLYLSSTGFWLPNAKGSYFVWPAYVSDWPWQQKVNYLDEFGNTEWPLSGIYVNFAYESQSLYIHGNAVLNTDLITSYSRIDWISLDDAYIQRIDSNGVLQWAPGGVALENGIGHSAWVYLVEPEPNLFIGGYYYELINVFADLYAQKVDTSGNLLWGQEGSVVCNYSGIQEGVQLVPDGQGGAIFFWDDQRSSVFPDIYTQRLDALGNRLWNPDGVPVIVETAEQYVQDVLADGQGGAFFSYTTGSGYSPRVGRLNPSGQLLWTAQPGPGGSGYGGIDLVPDDAGGFYAIWSSVPAWQIYAQRYNADGQPLWLAGGLPVSHSPGSDDDAEAVSDNAGGFIVVWNNAIGSEADNIYAQHVTSGAELLWGLSDLIVCSQGDWQWLPRALPDGYGGVVASWADYRNAASPNLYGQRVLSNGILGNFPELELMVTPLDTPIVLPSAGGSFRFRVNLQNNFGAPLRFDFWTNVLLPNGSNYGPLLLRNDATISTGGSLSRTLTQTVPAGAPAGQYLYRVWVGDHPVAPWDGGSFTFTKLGSGSGGDWAAQGWELPALPPQEKDLPSRFELFPAYPNPFNVTTAIRFALPEAAWVRLEVFDVSGREVGALGRSAAPFGGAFVSGSGATPTMYAAGTHEITFDGSRLASGIYLYRLQAGQYSASGKLVLLK